MQSNWKWAKIVSAKHAKHWTVWSQNTEYRIHYASHFSVNSFKLEEIVSSFGIYHANHVIWMLCLRKRIRYAIIGPWSMIKNHFDAIKWYDECRSNVYNYIEMTDLKLHSIQTVIIVKWISWYEIEMKNGFN